MLIGLMGKKRSGKDTFAGALTREHGFTRYAFADPLKAALLELNPVLEGDPADSPCVRLADWVNCYGWEIAKDTHPEVRRLLQAMGHGIREHVDLDVWVRATTTKVWNAPGDSVVTDVRYLNEAETVRNIDVGGVLVRIVRPSSGDSGDTHPSENVLDTYPADYTIYNDGSVEDLERAASHLWETLTGQVGSGEAPVTDLTPHLEGYLGRVHECPHHFNCGGTCGVFDG